MSDNLPLPKTKSKEKLMAEVDRCFQKLTNKEMSALLKELVEVVDVLKRIATEPQVRVSTTVEYAKRKYRGKRKRTGSKRLIELNLVEHISVGESKDAEKK
jgi:hypothetical protein